MVSQSGSCGRQLTCQLPRTRSLMCCTRRLKTQKAIDEAAVSEHTDGKFNGKEETWGEKKVHDSGDNFNLERTVKRKWWEVVKVWAAMPSASVGALCFIRSKFCQITTIIVSYLLVCTVAKNQTVTQQDAIRWQ